MKIHGYFVLFAMLVIALAVAAGCTTGQQAPAATRAPSAAPQETYQAPAATARMADIDTKISVRFNEYACVNVGDFLGVTYLYPDQKFKFQASQATAPGAGTINVNILFVDENDQLKFRQAKPQWDTVKKTWVYEGIMPLAQFFDITTPVEKSFTIKTQSKYYICADDRKESGVQDITYLVPVKLTRL